MSSARTQILGFLQIFGLLILASSVVYFANRGTEELSDQLEDQISETSGSDQSLDNLTEKVKSAKYTLTKFNPEKSSPGFTLLPVSGTAETLLLNHRGQTVHRWMYDAERVRILNDCNLLVLHGSKWGMREDKWRALKFYAREYSWDGAINWEVERDEWTHHDLHRLDNGNYIFLERASIPVPENMLPKGADASEYSIRSDSILEISDAGEVVWKWNAHDHFDLDYCGARGCPKSFGGRDQRGESKSKTADGEEGPEKVRDWTHVNTVSPLPPNKWFDSGDTRFRPGNILTIVRNFWMAFLIDKQTGEIVWKYDGDPVPSNPDTGMIRGHDIHMIPKGLPGAGNLLVFDNGNRLKRVYSRILELNPIDQSVVWEYSDPANFYSDAAGSMQRLPNGNTLISEDKSGRVFEVTPEKEIVWELKGKLRVSRAYRYDDKFCKKFEELSPIASQ